MYASPVLEHALEWASSTSITRELGMAGTVSYIGKSRWTGVTIPQEGLPGTGYPTVSRYRDLRHGEPFHLRIPQPQSSRYPEPFLQEVNLTSARSQPPVFSCLFPLISLCFLSTTLGYSHSQTLILFSHGTAILLASYGAAWDPETHLVFLVM